MKTLLVIIRYLLNVGPQKQKAPSVNLLINAGYRFDLISIERLDFKCWDETFLIPEQLNIRICE